MKKIGFVEFISHFPNQIDLSMKIGDFKKLIEQYTKIKAKNQFIRIILNLDNDDSLYLTECLELQIYDITAFPSSIKINDYYKKKYYLDLNKSVEELKQKIHDKIKIPLKSIQFNLENNIKFDNKDYIFPNHLFENKISIKTTEPPMKKLLKVKFINCDVKEICTDLLNTGFSFLEELLGKKYTNEIPYDICFNNKLISMMDLLCQYDIKEGDLIELKERENIEIKVKFLTGKTLIYKVTKNDTILLLRLMIELEEGILIDESEDNLIFLGKMLKNEQTFGYYNIQNGDVLHLVLRLRG